MNTLPAQELKRRGVAALEESLEKGPVHIIKNNRPTCVVMREEDFAKLSAAESKSTRALSSLWDWLDKPPTGKMSKAEIKKNLTRERKGWSR
ncbi:MAG: type II toxin-antitoxin system Phd/YefM family antitoxin [Deltaproteobacteria bacterium]|nr:type II toxin-antitoxin system Phd/YefM family antitoxin [Deltaproteobacteria bacterium]